MSTSLATGTGQTLSVTTLTPVAPAVGLWTPQVLEAGNTVIKNTNGALDQPNTIRYSISPVADMFKNADCRAMPDQRTDGINLLVQVNEVWKVTESLTGEYYYLPVSAHCVLKLPADVAVTATQVAALATRLAGATYRGASEAATVGWGVLLHGVTRLPDTV